MSVLIWIQTVGTPIVFLKEFFEKIILKEVSRQQQKHERLPSMQRVEGISRMRYSETVRSLIWDYFVCTGIICFLHSRVIKASLSKYLGAIGMIGRSIEFLLIFKLTLH